MFCLSFGRMINPGKYFMQLEETKVASLPVLEIAGPRECPVGKWEKENGYSKNSETFVEHIKIQSMNCLWFNVYQRLKTSDICKRYS